MELPIVFEECHQCGSVTTVCQQAMKEENLLIQGTTPPVDIKLTPLQNITGFSTPTMKVLIRHYDTCANCGIDRCVRVEKKTIPMKTYLQAQGLVPLHP